MTSRKSSISLCLSGWKLIARDSCTVSQDIEITGRKERSYTSGFTETVWSAEMMLEAAGELPQLSDPDRQYWHAWRAGLAVIEQRL